MTETSYFHNGTALNDALNAPYSADEFSELLELLHGPTGKTFVLPGQLNNLEVTAGAGRSVDVASGRAFVNGRWYENTASVNLALPTNTSGFARWDRVFIEINLTTGVGALKTIQGGYATIPPIPDLKPAKDVVQLPLARIYVPDSYVAVSAIYVHDERVFANNAYHQLNYSTRNLFINGNFVLFGCNPDDTAARRPMDTQWATVANGARWRGVSAFSSQMYGRAVYSDKAQAGGDGFSAILLSSETSSDMFTLSMWIHVKTGEATVSLGAVSMRVPATLEPINLIIRGSVTGYLTLSVLHQTADTEFKFGDIRFFHGFVIGDERHVGPALVMLSTPVEAYKTGAPVLTGLAAGPGGVTVDFGYWGSDEDYESALATASPYANLIVIIAAKDSGSAGGSPIFSIAAASLTYDLLRIDLGGLTNSTYRYATGLIPQATSNSERLQGLIAFYTAVTSMDAAIWIVGAIL